MTLRTRTSRQGFTLIEALIGTGVFAIGIMGSAGLMAWIMQATASNGRIVTAVATGQAQLEELMDDEYEDLAGGTNTEGKYALAWTVDNFDGYREIAVDVTWSNSEGRDSKVSLSSMIAEERVVAVMPSFLRPGNGGTGGTSGTSGTPSEDVSTEPVTD